MRSRVDRARRACFDASPIFAGLLCVAVGCAPGCGSKANDPHLGRAEGAIVAGANDDADASVVGVAFAWQRCTGTIVAPRVVLTAAHCIGAIEDARITFGASIDAPEATRRASTLRVHPLFDPATLAHDVAVILLDDDAPPTVLPVPLLDEATAVALAPDAVVRVVGFGRTTADDRASLRKRSGVARIDRVGDDDFRLLPAPSQPCLGDSGGPAFVSFGGVEFLAGVTSSGDAACAEYAREIRVDREAPEFVAPFVRRWAVGATQVGERCYGDAQCARGTCYAPDDAPQSKYCSSDCSSDAACGDDMRCVSSRCVYPDPSPGTLGGACEADLDCARGVCAAAADGKRSCRLACIPNGAGCGEGARCVDDALHADRHVCTSTPAFDDSPMTGSACSASPSRGGRDSAATFGSLAVLVLAKRRRRANGRAPVSGLRCVEPRGLAVATEHRALRPPIARFDVAVALTEAR